MTARAFPFCTIEREGKKASALRIDCGCGVSAFFRTPRVGHREAATSGAAEVHFRGIGWTIGNRPKSDRCPDCTSRAKLEKGTVMKAAADEPREMSREDRRIIFTKIDELYLSDKTGYSAPWTDSAVARDLGVPRAWVSAVREDLFGPEGSNPEFDDFLAKAAPVITDMKNLFHAAQVQLEGARKLMSRFEELERISKRIDREISKSA